MSAIEAYAHVELSYKPAILTEDGQLKFELIQVMGLAGMQPLSCTIDKINDWAQEHFLRTGERSDEQDAKFESLKSRVKPLLAEMGLVHASRPSLQEYQGAIVHGSTLQRVRLRLNYLIEQWNQGVRFNQIYFLTGARPLNQQTESMDDLFNPPKTEYDMVRMVWEKTEMPEMLRAVPVEFILAPMKGQIRPNTDDTVKHWLEMHPAHGNYLAVSNAPFTPRQDLVVRTFLTDEYALETIGPALEEHTSVAIMLDELARLIYQTTKFNKR